MPTTSLDASPSEERRRQATSVDRSRAPAPSPVYPLSTAYDSCCAGEYKRRRMLGADEVVLVSRSSRSCSSALPSLLSWLRSLFCRRSWPSARLLGWALPQLVAAPRQQLRLRLWHSSQLGFPTSLLVPSYLTVSSTSPVPRALRLAPPAKSGPALPILRLRSTRTAVCVELDLR